MYRAGPGIFDVAARDPKAEAETLVVFALTHQTVVPGLPRGAVVMFGPAS